MDKYIFLIFIFVFILFHSCETPQDYSESYANEGVQLITANFLDGSGNFVSEGEAPYKDTIKIVFPYYYPESSKDLIDISKLRLSANLPVNALISPTLGVHDLNEPLKINVTAADGTKFNHTIIADIRKSNKAEILEFKIPSLGINGVINEKTKTISLIALGEIEPTLAEINLSYHATISPDPTKEILDYNNDVKFTVTAHDGISKNVYTVKKEIPKKLPSGIRSGSATLLFAKRLQADLGINVTHLTGGIAVSGDYIVLNTRDNNSIYINAKTGEKEGEIDLGEVKGNLVNFYNTADDNGNVLICNLSPNAGSFKIWKLSSIESIPELYLEWNGGASVGRKLSVIGSIDKDAIITAPLLGGANQKFARWTVSEGVLNSQNPEIINMTGLEKGWTTNVDLIYSSPTDINSDYFVASYSDNTFAWINGSTNSVYKKLDPISVNYIMNAVDFIEFNNAKYVTMNWVNSFTWGAADMVWLLDVTNGDNFEGDLNAETVKSVIWKTEVDKWGAKAVIPVVANTNGTGDVALSCSNDGYYLYLYFIFTNGYVVGYQFDCIDM